MECNLVALDKRPGVHPVRIEETLLRALTKIVKREAGDQTKIACGNLHMCAGLEDGIEDAKHAVVQRRLERVRGRDGERRRQEDLWRKRRVRVWS